MAVIDEEHQEIIFGNPQNRFTSDVFEMVVS